MNTRINLIAAAIALAAAGATGTAFAQAATYELPQPVSSVTTRAAVQAEALSARAAGTLLDGEVIGTPRTTFVATRSRDEVRAEVLQAARAGLTAAVGRDDNSFDGQVLARSVAVPPSMVAAAR